MKIAIIAAAGKQGSLLVKEALSRGHQVTAIVRSEDKANIQASKVLVKDLFDLTYEDIKENDVIIDAFGAWTPETVGLHQTSLKHLADILSGKANRLLVVGGAGSLYVDNEHKTRVMDTPDFPADWKPLASNMGAAFEALQKRNDVNWTYLSPSANFVADGPRTGKYKIGKDKLMLNSKDESMISYADYAIAMIDEAENAKYIKERFTVVSE
ncbi:MAG: NAD(P)-dependent oxidoreductase [Elusimicrobiota bacterium]|jgi:putative NADH-flavin reductase|nr:NAD(P)-dependent oxidoreductase [Elusimicrobiota bacterium]